MDLSELLFFTSKIRFLIFKDLTGIFYKSLFLFYEFKILSSI